MIVNHNMPAMNTNRMLGINNNNKSKSLERMSSGYRINRAADDASGLTISEKMRAQIRGLERGSKNVSEGISMVQTADGALGEIHSIVHRIRELAIQASNDVNCEEDREAINCEIQALKDETNRIFRDTEFNTQYIFRVPYIPEPEIIPVEQLIERVPTRISESLPPGSTMLGTSDTTRHMTDTYTDSNGNQYCATRIDFSGAAANMSDLSQFDKTGFFSTCCTCDAHYCIALDSATNENSVDGDLHKTYTVGIADCQTPADLVNAIVNATGGNPNRHFTNFAVDPNDPTGQTLLIYDNRPGMTAGGDFGIIDYGVTVETVNTPKTATMQLFNIAPDPSDPSGMPKYGGIEANDVRHTWDEMGISISPDGKTFEVDLSVYPDGEQTVEFWDYTGEHFLLNIKDGASLSSITRTNQWSADSTGVYINDVFAQNWTDIGVQPYGNSGSYTITYRDMKIGFTVNDGDSLDDIIAGINGNNINHQEITWDTVASRHVITTALDIIDCSTVTVTNANKDKLDPDFLIQADGNGVLIKDTDGNTYPKQQWDNMMDDFQNTSPNNDPNVTNDDYPIIDWGLTDIDGQGHVDGSGIIQSDAITFDDMAEYEYSTLLASGDPMPLGFRFKLADEAGLAEAIAALNNAPLQKQYHAPGKVTMTPETGSNNNLSIELINPYSATEDVSYEVQKEYGRDFGDTLPNVLEGNITRTFIRESGSAISNSSISLAQPSTPPSSMPSPTISTVYVQNATDGKYYAYSKSVFNYEETEHQKTIKTETGSGVFEYTGEFNGETIETKNGKPTSYTKAETIMQSRACDVTEVHYTLSSATGLDLIDIPTGGVTETSKQQTTRTPKEDWKDDSTTTSFNFLNKYDVIDLSVAGKRTFMQYKVDNNSGTLDTTTIKVDFTADKHATCSFTAKENSAGNINDSTRFEDIRLDPPEKKFWIQAGANAYEGINLNWYGMNNAIIGLSGVNTLDFTQSQRTINAADYALNFVSTERSKWGSHQNRLEHAGANDDNSAENTQFSESRIRDADMAYEALQLARSTILEQAGQAMLSNANHAKDGVMTLLQGA